MALAALLLAGCASLSERFSTKTYEGVGKGAPTAIVKMRGYRFWPKNQEKRAKSGRLSKEKYDILRLAPGEHMLGFIRIRPRAGGAAFCKLEAGRTYSFEVTGQQYMPKSGSYILRGRCTYDPDREENRAGSKGAAKTG